MKLHFRPESCSFSFLSGITDDFSIFASHSLCACSTVSAPRLSPLLLLLHTPPPPLPHATSADPSRGLVSWVSLSRKMELSESVQRGLQSLADPSSFDQSGFQVLTGVSFRSLLSSHGDPGVLGELPPLLSSPPPLLSPPPPPLPVSPLPSFAVWMCLEGSCCLDVFAGLCLCALCELFDAGFPHPRVCVEIFNEAKWSGDAGVYQPR